LAHFSTEAIESMRALDAIRSIDYTVIFARDMQAMRRFYEDVLQFPIYKELGPQWISYHVGSNILALTQRGMMFTDAETPPGALSVQLAFRVPPKAVDACAAELAAAGVAIVFPPTDQPWGHRTLFFRDPDGNVLEIYADI
jgi:lactoylglutathione lyase